MVNLLIPYTRLPHHQDPMLDEFTYGDSGKRARKLKQQVSKGDMMFFHTTAKIGRCITAYYVADRVLDVEDAAKNNLIRRKYRNPHIGDYLTGQVDPQEDNAILFGDPILSKVLTRPLPFDRKLAKSLSLGIPFTKARSDAACITSATRQWRELARSDVRLLRREIRKQEKAYASARRLFSTDEVHELQETDLEEIVARNPVLLEAGLTLEDRQIELTPDDRIDLLFRRRDSERVVVEMKAGLIGRSALEQIKRYMHKVRKAYKSQTRGIIVCKGVQEAFLPVFERAEGVKVHRYGWKFGLAQIAG